MRETMFPEQHFRISTRSGQYEFYECVVPQPPGQELDSYIEMWGDGGRLTILPIGSEHLSVSASQNALYGTQYVRQGLRDYREFRNRFMTRFSGLLVKDEEKRSRIRRRRKGERVEEEARRSLIRHVLTML
jgi:hypothetical protein